MIWRFLGLVLTFAFSRTLLLTDRLSFMIGPLVTAVLWLRGEPVPDNVAALIATATVATIMAVILLRLIAAPFFVWKEDQETLLKLREALDEPERREREVLLEHRLRLRQELGERLAQLVAMAECAQEPEAWNLSYSAKDLAKITRRIAEIVSALSYDHTLRVAALNLQRLCFRIMDAYANGSATTELLDRLWAQRKLTFQLIHREDEVHEVVTYARLSNLIEQHGESFSPKDDPPDEISAEAEESMRDFQRWVAENETRLTLIGRISLPERGKRRQ